MISLTLEIGIDDEARVFDGPAFLKYLFYPADINAVLERYYGLHESLK
jgi:hypothetical protein